MVVAPRVREIENEIDSKVRALKIWQRPKRAVLADIMQAYRDSIEVVFAECLFFQLHAEHDRAAAGGIGVVRAQENRWRAGTLWALKWASEFCPEDGGTGSSRPEELADLLTLGAMYETFVDALKRANHGSLEIDVDEGTRTIICYEGARATAFDTSIVSHQWVTSPVTHHLSLTEESDQITSRWTAGDYRRVVRGLATYAAGKENDIIIDAAYVAKF